MYCFPLVNYLYTETPKIDTLTTSVDLQRDISSASGLLALISVFKELSRCHLNCIMYYSRTIVLPKHSGLKEMSSKAMSPCGRSERVPLNCNAYLKKTWSILYVCSCIIEVIERVKEKSREMKLPTMWNVRPAMAQTSLRIRTV